MFQISNIVSNVDSVIKDNTLHAFHNEVHYRVKFSQKLHDGTLFYHKSRATWVKASLLELMRKTIVPLEFNDMTPIDPEFKSIGFVRNNINTIRKVMVAKGIFRYDKYSTIKAGYIHMFWAGGMIKLKTGIKGSYKILTDLIFRQANYVELVKNDKYIGIKFSDSIYEVTLFSSIVIEESLVAPRILPKIKGDFESLNNISEYSGVKFETFVNEDNTILEKSSLMEIYNTTIF